MPQCPPQTAAPPIDAAPECDGRTWLDPGFRTQLTRAGMASVDDLLSASSGRCLRRLNDRENWYLRLDVVHSPESGFYLKKHCVPSGLTGLLKKLGLGSGRSAARIEAQNMQLLAVLGIDAARLVAYGERVRDDGLWESFLVTEELVGYQELQTFLRQRFARPASRRRGGDLERLLRQVATLARRLHASGYTHRDLYCCHFLVKEQSPGVFDVRMIDLHRLARRRWFRRRWIVKDLAQLSYSAPRDRIGCREKVLFLRHYLGVRKLGRADKRLIRAIARKQRLMEWKLGPGDGR